MVHLDLWRRVGGFDPDYFLYWEDVDLCRRVVEAGGRVSVDETAVVTHAEGGTHGHTGSARTKSPIYYYYNIRNRMLYAAKHLPPAGRRRWALTSPWVAYQVLLQGGRRQFAHPRKSLWPALRGVLDGLRCGRLLGDGRA